MKKVMLSLLVLIIVSCVVALTGCIGPGHFTWDDVPVYPVTQQQNEDTWSKELIEVSPTQWIQFTSFRQTVDVGGFERAEWRYYYYDDAYVKAVYDFYVDEMPERGWNQIIIGVWGISSLTYTKKDAHVAAVYIGGGIDPLCPRGEVWVALFRAGPR
jgi:hypothetical protein